MHSDRHWRLRSDSDCGPFKTTHWSRGQAAWVTPPTDSKNQTTWEYVGGVTSCLSVLNGPHGHCHFFAANGDECICTLLGLHRGRWFCLQPLGRPIDDGEQVALPFSAMLARMPAQQLTGHHSPDSLPLLQHAQHASTKRR